MKKFIAGFVSGALLFGIVGAGATGVWDNISVLKNDITVVVNGETVTADNFVYNDTTYLPLRAVSTALGEAVEYDEATNTAYIGERIDNAEMKSKYIPPEDLKYGIEFENGVYYVLPTYIIDLADSKGLHTNVKELLENRQEMTLEIGEYNWKMMFLPDGIGDIRVIPYDTYVDEIEPLLK